MKCVAHRLAEQDLLQAIAYYEKQAPGLGADLLAAFEEALILLRRHPTAAPVVRGGIRRLVMPRFPYNIVYRVDPDRVRILAVAHQRRSQSYWNDRR